MVVGIVLIYITLFVYCMSYSDIEKERRLWGDARDDLYMMKSTYYSLDMIIGRFPDMNKTIVMVTHDERIAAYSDRIIQLYDGDTKSSQNN